MTCCYTSSKGPFVSQLWARCFYSRPHSTITSGKFNANSQEHFGNKIVSYPLARNCCVRWEVRLVNAPIRHRVPSKNWVAQEGLIDCFKHLATASPFNWSCGYCTYDDVWREEDKSGILTKHLQSTKTMPTSLQIDSKGILLLHVFRWTSLAKDWKLYKNVCGRTGQRLG